LSLLDGDPESVCTLAGSADWIPTVETMAPTVVEKAIADREAIVVYFDLASDQISDNDANPMDDTEITNLIELITQSQTDLMDINRRIIGSAPSNLDDHVKAFKVLYMQSNKLLSKLRSLQSTQPINAVLTITTTKQVSEVRLPRLELPHFDGDLLQWVSFRDMFRSAVHNNSNISDAQKLTYLKGQLRGEASRLIQSMLITDANYQIPWKSSNYLLMNGMPFLFSLLLRNLI